MGVARKYTEYDRGKPLCETMANVLGVGVGSIKVGMHRLRAALRDCVERRINTARSLP